MPRVSERLRCAPRQEGTGPVDRVATRKANHLAARLQTALELDALGTLATGLLFTDFSTPGPAQRAAFPKGNPYLTLCDKLGTLYYDEHFFQNAWRTRAGSRHADWPVQDATPAMVRLGVAMVESTKLTSSPT